MARDSLTLLFSPYPTPLPSAGVVLPAWALVALSVGTGFVTLGIFAGLSHAWRWWSRSRGRMDT